jgi:hypothetical protein
MAFQSDIGARLIAPPVVAKARVVGSYRFLQPHDDANGDG